MFSGYKFLAELASSYQNYRSILRVGLNFPSPRSRERYAPLGLLISREGSLAPVEPAVESRHTDATIAARGSPYRVVSDVICSESRLVTPPRVLHPAATHMHPVRPPPLPPSARMPLQLQWRVYRFATAGR